MLNSELNQTNITIKNKDMVIEQLKSQIEELNQLLIQSEEDLKSFEENKEQELGEYNSQIELLIQEKNVLQAQNIELTENLSLANENLKKFNDLISDKYANIEAELFKQTNLNENLEKKYKGVLKQMKNKQKILHRENSKLKEIINNQELQKTQLDLINQNQKQNLSLYNTVMGQRNFINQTNDNNTTNQSIYNYGNANHTNLINNEEIQESWGGNGMDYKNNLNLNYNYNYNNNITNTNNTNSSYIDPKEAGQKKTLNEFKKLLNKIDEKLDMP
jgi:hypothetical protein